MQQEIKKVVTEFLRVFLLLLIIVFVLIRIIEWNGWVQKTVVCDAESVAKKDGADWFVWGNYFFGAGNLQSKEIAHTGSASCKLSRDYQYALNYAFTNLRAGEPFSAEIYFYKSRITVGEQFSIVASIGNKFYKASFDSTKIANQWIKSTLEFKLPDNIKSSDTLQFYCWSFSNDNIYADDFRITRQFHFPF